MNDLYERQEELNLSKPDKVTVIGIGGVGSWTAFNLALAGARKLYVVDPDEIERHNLNRTPFKQSHVGMKKTEALIELIAERRADTEVVPINKRIEECSSTFVEDMSDSKVIDCRDHSSEMPKDIMQNVIITAGYDGLEYSLHVNPDYESLWGEGTSEYETVPSFIAPCQYLASLITTYIMHKEINSESEIVKSSNMITDMNGLNEHFEDGDNSE